MADKTRLDIWLTEHDLVPSRQRAQALVLAGVVYVNEQPARSAAQLINETDRVEVRRPDHPYVSRGGIKLAYALDKFGIPVAGRVAVDVGASTGGFTDCLLRHGARKVYAVDVGTGQLDWKLRQDPRVVPLERTNVRYWQGAELQERIGIVTIDVSFISLKQVVPPLWDSLQGRLERDSDWVLLVKPQFEAGREEASAGRGVIRDPQLRERIVHEIEAFVIDLGWRVRGVVPAPIKGPKGNQEYLLAATSPSIS